MVRLWDRIRADGGVGLITAVGMAGFVLVVYVIVVVGGGALLGRTVSPSVWLSCWPPRSWRWPSSRCAPGCAGPSRD